MDAIWVSSAVYSRAMDIGILAMIKLRFKEDDGLGIANTLIPVHN